MPVGTLKFLNSSAKFITGDKGILYLDSNNLKFINNTGNVGTIVAGQLAVGDSFPVNQGGSNNSYTYIGKGNHDTRGFLAVGENDPTGLDNSDSLKYGFKFIYSTTGKFQLFRHENSTTGNDVLTVLRNNGFIGINTQSPTTHFHINGNQVIRNTGSQSVLSLINNLNGYPWNIYTNYHATHNNFHIAREGVGVYMSPGDTSWRSTSDDRLKHNEIHITNGLDVIMQLQPQVYNRTSEMLDADFNGNLDELDITYYKEIGFIAQEVNQIDELKHIVDLGGDEEQNWSILYQQIIPYNTAAIKELKIKNDTLETEVSTLKTEVSTLKTQLADVLARLSVLENN